MVQYAQILNLAIPIFLFLIVIEWAIARKKIVDIYNSFDTISSLSSGMTNILKDVLGLSIIIISYDYLLEKFSFFTIENSIALYVITFIGLDFAGYWGHRLEHEINVLWNRHIIHHSSEEFNLACALRQNISAIVAIFTIFLLPLAILGVPTKVIAISAPLHLFAQFWYHTRLINKMGWLEKVIVTPSHHRVHHAINPEYLDKNYSQIIILWDKVFGTFQEELESVPPVYGVKRPVQTWNPILINFQHLYQIIKDAWYTNNFRDKFLIWFKPTGWRPADLIHRMPVTIIQNPYNQIKYKSRSNAYLKKWSIFQLFFTLAILLLFFSKIGNYSINEQFIIALYLFITIYSYTSLMDGDSYSFIAELLRIIMVIYIISALGSFLDLYFWPIMTIHFVSFIISIYFTYINKEGIETGLIEKVV